MTINIKGVIFEDFVNYKKPSMVIEFPYCDFKCDRECGRQVCQNTDLASAPIITIDPEKLIQQYINNPITEAIICQGLEPLDSPIDLCCLLYTIRVTFHCSDDIVIYTGYNKGEAPGNWIEAIKYKNIIVKYGRFIPDQKSHYDPILGVKLASDNQYAKRLS